MTWVLKANLKGPKGDKGDMGEQGLPGTGAVPADAAVAGYVAGTSATQAALDKRFQRVLTPEQFGAAGNGTTDDSVALNAMLAAVTPGTLISGSKTYRHISPLSITSKTGWAWRGGTYIFAATGASVEGAVRGIGIDSCADFAFEDIRMECVTQSQQYVGLRVFDSDFGVVERCIAYNYRWVGLAAHSTSTNITFRDCQALRCRFGGYSLANGTKFLGGRYSSEWSLTAEFTTKGGVWDSTSLYYDGIIIGGTGWIIDDVTLDDNGQSGVYGGDGTTRGVVSSCRISGNWNKGIDFGTTGAGAIEGIEIIGNTVEGNKTGDIHLEDCTNCGVIGNTVYTNVNTFSIGLNGVSKGNTIMANQLRSTAPSAAAVFVNSATGSIENTIVTNSVHATVPYSVDAATNILITASAGIYAMRSALQVNRSDQAGFAGRFMVGLTASSDNAIAQFASNKPIQFTDFEGARIQLQPGGIESTGVITTQRGTTAGRPTAAMAQVGAMYYDTTLGLPIWSNGTVWKNAAGVTV